MLTLSGLRPLLPRRFCLSAYAPTLLERDRLRREFAGLTIGFMASNFQLPCILLTGFDAFGRDRHQRTAINPSWLTAKALHGEQIAGHRIVAAQLPTKFHDCTAELMRLLQLHQPALVICLGLAGNRNALSLERVAINVDDARIPDNAGAQPVDVPVVPGGPAAYFSTLPIKAMRQAIANAGIPAEVSQSAGTFVCNHLFYGLMHALATEPALAQLRGGFIHVPHLQVSDTCGPESGLPLKDMVRGLRLAVEAALRLSDDIVQSAGSIS